MVYTVGAQADPGGIVRAMTEGLAALGLQVLSFNHEYMNSQYEINLGTPTRCWPPIRHFA